MDSFAPVEELIGQRIDFQHGVAPVSAHIVPFAAGSDLTWR